MKFAKTCIILVLLIISIGAVSAAEPNDDVIEITQDSQYAKNEIRYTFLNLTNEIDASQDTFDMQHDYTFNNESDTGYILIKKDNFTINGNNHVLDGSKQSGIFNITGNNVTINDLVFTNGKTYIGGIVHSTGVLTLNNVTFIMNNVTYLSDHTQYHGGAVASYGGKLNCYNSTFIDNHAESGSAIFVDHGELNVKNTHITSGISNRYGQIWASHSKVNLDNVDFINISSRYSPALSLEYCDYAIIVNSRFINLTADISAGAISLKREGNLYIKNCQFINTKSFKNAGAIIVDYMTGDYDVAILDCLFYNASSLIGGAYIQLGCNLVMNNTAFINNRAAQDGGAVYLAFTNSEINNCTFDSNAVESREYPSCGGAIYSDYNDLEIHNSRFINNSAYGGNAIYACDTYYLIADSTFKDNDNAIYTEFDRQSNLTNNNYNNDTVFPNETFEYETYINTTGLKFVLLNNTIDVTSIPSKFDLREWGWVSPVKNQGHMGSCWTFAMIGALESAILKAYGIEFDLSEGNLHHNMLRYFIYGNTDLTEGGNPESSASYLLGWYGPVLEEIDIYDEVGKLSPYITQVDYDVIHVQDVMFIRNDDVPDGLALKSAILKYGAVTGRYYAEYGDEGYYDVKRASQYVNESLYINHEILIVGWDDNYSKDNFLIAPPGDGAWIVKNSWGTLFGDDGYLYLSYYDKSFLNSTRGSYASAIILDNTIPYNKNYQHDFAWDGDFYDFGVNVTYANRFEAADDDLIAAVGTYFDSGGVNYTVKIYVNDEVKLVQEGISPFFGFHTIKLNEYVPIKKGDVFMVEITSNAMPFVFNEYSRVHYCENTSYMYDDVEGWLDLYGEWEVIACIKAYTVVDDSRILKNSDVSVDYAGGKCFSVKVVTADGHAVVGADVKFTINGK
ncbi:C1 family peptidase, partial [uncultured Methanobrevibacter sp.]|uniref:C1 family peptidase n=1 Tax=uncultured Methanobrevibacter sp. TaxID=253161 RepID=UPI00262DD36D